MIKMQTMGTIGFLFLFTGIIKIIFKWCPHKKIRIEELCKRYNKNIEDIDERKYVHVDSALSLILGIILIIAGYILNFSFIYSVIFTVISGILAHKIYYTIRDKYLNLK